MCCCIIKTDVLLANIFAKLKDVKRVSFQIISSYLNFLSDNFPTYVISDLSVSNIKKCVEQYPKLYGIEEVDGRVFVVRGEMSPRLSFFNSIYNDSTSNYIERTTESFVKELCSLCKRK